MEKDTKLIKNTIKKAIKLNNRIIGNNNYENIFVMTSLNADEISDLKGNKMKDYLDSNLFNHVFSSAEKLIKEKPKGFNLKEKGTFNLIYIPNSKICPESFTSKGFTLDSILDIFEETFHALDDIPYIKCVDDQMAKEALAVFGRYIGIRYLKNKNYSINNVLESSIGVKLIIKDDQYWFGEDISKNHNYIGRLWLVDAIKHLEKLKFIQAIDEMKVTYEKVKSSGDYFKTIQEYGEFYGSRPHDESYINCILKILC